MQDERSQPIGPWPDDEELSERERQLPEYEIDRDTSIGGGILSAGGTAENRTAGSPTQSAGDLDDAAPDQPQGPPAHLDKDDNPVMDEPNRWVFPGRTG